MKIKILLLICIISLALLPNSVWAQSYYFSVDKLLVDVYWNEDGSASIDYLFQFNNQPNASPIEYVDVGLPNTNFVDSSIQAFVDGIQVFDINRNDFQGEGDAGVAVGLGSQSIQPGDSGEVRVFIGRVDDVLYHDDQEDNYASAVFTPTWFGSQYVTGSTDMQVTYHLPPGVQPDQPRWHEAPSGFPSEPETALDQDGRVIYIWRNTTARADTQYRFGASFPVEYIPEETIVTPSATATLSTVLSGLSFGGCFIGFFVLFGGIIFLGARSSQRRKLQYFPPKVAIEGHGIKRGLTAIEAAILMEQPLDKVLTMLLFSTIKKNAAKVSRKEPLEVQVIDINAEGLYDYETKFLSAFKFEGKRERQQGMQKAVQSLIESVSEKMKGFSRDETTVYYRDIVKRAWEQVETAQTPQVKSEKFDELLEWTMLDKNADDRTRDVFRTGPVYVPTWWSHYDPTYSPRVPSTQTPTSGGQVSLPHLPGSDFAASIANGVQNFSGSVVGSIGSFTEGVTLKTNPLPPPPRYTDSGSRGGSSHSSSCACACACAGCACACAGGGR